MPEHGSPQEPTMEEILASIRRIISEEDEEAREQTPRSAMAAPRHAPAVEPEPEPEPEPEFEPEPEPVYEPEIAAPAAAHVVDERDSRDAFEMTHPMREPEPARTYVHEPVERTFDEGPHTMGNADAADQERGAGGLLSRAAAGAAAKSFGSLTRNMAVTHESGGGQSLEDMVRDMLQPLLKDWLDQHLPPIVEQLVQEEIERVARRGR